MPLLVTSRIYFLTAYLADWREWSMVIFAAIVIVMMRTYPGGLAAMLERIGRGLRSR